MVQLSCSMDKKRDWIKEEDEIIIQKVQEFGTKWSKMTKILRGRTDNDIKNRWYTHLSKIIEEEEKPSSDF
jgi:hypothetical protein